jgi:hypothetical protein
MRKREEELLKTIWLLVKQLGGDVHLDKKQILAMPATWTLQYSEHFPDDGIQLRALADSPQKRSNKRQQQE